MGDCIECLGQRCLDYKSTSVRIAYGHIKTVLVDPTVKRVILIGHSQGGIIISLVIDQLFAELPATSMSKLEIYTFGSAASHFSNPLVSATAKVKDSCSGGEKSASPRHVISHIEHYANEYDLVCRWGVLHCTEGVLNNRYAGSIFVRMDARGHMLNQHYLDYIFPIPDEKTPNPGQDFLDSIVSTDTTLAMGRETAAVNAAADARKQKGATNAGIDNARPGHMLCKSDGVIHGEAQNRTVRGLSRLWKYQNGRCPSPLRIAEE